MEIIESQMDNVFNCVIPYIRELDDRNSVSLVCRKWCELESMTRKHVTIRMCYSTTPSCLTKRYRYLESLTLKGKPTTALPQAQPFQPDSNDWGGYVAPWVQELATSFNCLKGIQFKRMIVRDSDLEILAQTRGRQLRVLKIYDCSGFSTDGLLHIGKHCNNLTTLCLQKSEIVDKDGEWLHELALNSTGIESLNYYETKLDNYDYNDLVLIAKNCSESLVSLKIEECDSKYLVDVFRHAINLEDLGVAPFYEPGTYVDVKLPPKLRCVAMTYLMVSEIPIVLDYAHQLTELDLLYAILGADHYSLLVGSCPNLEVLYTRDDIGDLGLQVVSVFCKKLRRITIEKGTSEVGLVTQIGLTALALGCVELEHLHAYIKDITNAALECIGVRLKNLYDFRIVSVSTQERTNNVPLDDGVRALLSGCTKLGKLGIYLRPPVLTDVGLGYIGKYGQNLRSLMLGFLGELNVGLVELSKGCPNLEKFEVRGCYFSELALATVVFNLTSLRYLWVQSYRVCENVDDVIESVDDFFGTDGDIFGGGGDILDLAHPYWNMELITPGANAEDEPGKSYRLQPISLLGYWSVAGQRTDAPDSVILLSPVMDID